MRPVPSTTSYGLVRTVVNLSARDELMILCFVPSEEQSQDPGIRHKLEQNYQLSAFGD